jgi:hypothetical protein
VPHLGGGVLAELLQNEIRKPNLAYSKLLQCIVFMQLRRVGVTDPSYLAPDLGKPIAITAAETPLIYRLQLSRIDRWRRRPDD